MSLIFLNSNDSFWFSDFLSWFGTNNEETGTSSDSVDARTISIENTNKVKKTVTFAVPMETSFPTESAQIRWETIVILVKKYIVEKDLQRKIMVQPHQLKSTETKKKFLSKEKNINYLMKFLPTGGIFSLPMKIHQPLNFQPTGGTKGVVWPTGGICDGQMCWGNLNSERNNENLVEISEGHVGKSAAEIEGEVIGFLISRGVKEEAVKLWRNEPSKEQIFMYLFFTVLLEGLPIVMINSDGKKLRPSKLKLETPFNQSSIEKMYDKDSFSDAAMSMIFLVLGKFRTKLTLCKICKITESGKSHCSSFNIHCNSNGKADGKTFKISTRFPEYTLALKNALLICLNSLQSTEQFKKSAKC